jgi:thymidylate kinase
MMYSERRKFAREKEELKTESDEVGEKLGKIFTALRDEAEEQIRILSGKPNLSDSEREILERLKEALDLSEELLEKEVEDVRKLLR